MANRRTILRSLVLAPLGDLRAEFAALLTPDPALAAVEATNVALAAYGEAVPLADEVAARNQRRVITSEDQATFDRT